MAPVRVKREKGADVKVKKEPGTAVKTSVKKELADDDARTGVKSKKHKFDQKTHYIHQVAFLNEVVPPPWKLCFGALGTGIIGIQPETPASSSRRKESEVPSRIPADATVVLLLNAPSIGVLGRNGNVMGGYGDCLDVESKSLHWKSQRSDQKGTKIGAIVAHQKNGGRVLVGVRGGLLAAGATSELAAKFKMLGVVSRISDVKEATFLPEDGSQLIWDGAKLHKEITVACLDSGLKTGIGLSTKRYPLSEDDEEQNLKFCSACCFNESNGRLHFAKLNKEGVAAYTSKRKPRVGKFGAKVGKKAKNSKLKKEQGDEAPRKRLRFKQEPPDWASSNGVVVKIEREDSPEIVRTKRAVREDTLDSPKLPQLQVRQLDAAKAAPVKAEPPQVKGEVASAVDSRLLLAQAFQSGAMRHAAWNPVPQALLEDIEIIGIDAD